MLVQRRQFLTAVAAAAVVYGLDRFSLGGDDPAAPKTDEPPQWFKDAVAEMKATKSPAIAIVLPAEKAARETLRAAIEDLLRDAELESQIHLLEAVYVVVEGRHVGAKSGETAVLLDADGKRVKGAAVTFTLREFAATVRPLLRDDDSLAKRAKAARTSEFEKLAAGVSPTDEEKVEAAVEALAAKFSTVGPAVIEAYESAKPGSGQASSFATVIRRAFVRRRDGQGDDRARPLPFGTSWKALPEPEKDPCPGCGMMMRRPRSNEILELLAKDDGKTK